jgi:hypothetical protein
MTQITLQIPDDLASDLEAIATVERKTVEQVALDRIQVVPCRKGSPAAVLDALRRIPPVSPTVIDELKASILEARLPSRDKGIFDNWPEA